MIFFFFCLVNVAIFKLFKSVLQLNSLSSVPTIRSLGKAPSFLPSFSGLSKYCIKPPLCIFHSGDLKIPRSVYIQDWV